MKIRLWKLCLIAALGIAPFVPAQAASKLIALCYHEVVHNQPPSDPFAVDTRSLVDHLEWLRAHGYTFVGMNDVLAEREGRRPLPEKAVLLTFDDGYRSLYKHVFPILKLYKAPAVVALVGGWLEEAKGAEIPGTRLVREDFLMPEEIREMQASGLIEFANHSHDLHRGILANPQGNVQPAATALRFEGTRYESLADQQRRVATDLARNNATIEKLTGKKPRIMVWPYGSYSQPLLEIARRNGMPITLTLNDGVNERSTPLAELRRVLVDANMTLTDFANEIRVREHEQDGLPPAFTRAMHVSLDQIYDPDPAAQEHKLGQLLDRVLEMGATVVYLQADGDADGDGQPDTVYFPNRHVPMRADLFNRAAWQLRTRAMVQVYASLPLQSFGLADRTMVAAAPGARERRVARELVEDLGASARFTGLLLRDDPGKPALAEPGANALLELASEQFSTARTYQPEFKSVITVYAGRLGNDGEASRLSDAMAKALPRVDYVELAPASGTPADETWLRQAFAVASASTPQPSRKIVFGLPSRDASGLRALDSRSLARAITTLHTLGAHHIAYTHDEGIDRQPHLATLKRAFSLRSQPER
ncbi:biofilm PGA synthesis lipoprotein PgaB [Crenobacter luteus]|uniref:poly-beta-1,6-N-acetyl-D-glucosamine N-deacetylase PgaB n=1 Tax=Crenobacter luteus TaxID=1452487 RepID=UPI0010434FB4|nr:poly-beta-1,6-N-acetyl-D-glucosamine N-deacetylase PgaB [Crenobacter luteus]TCP12444.1 biofilm PGA synthesis lipoprotein PgaB [Crenobacter luteus]